MDPAASPVLGGVGSQSWVSWLAPAVAAAIIKALEALDLKYPKVSEGKLKELDV